MDDNHRKTMAQAATRALSPGTVRPVRSSARAVGATLPDITRKAFERHGFPAASLIMDWPLVVGAEFAGFTAPEKLRWPRRKPDAEDGAIDRDAVSGRSDKAAGAQLTVRVDGARALELQHRLGELAERINTHFVYRAITDIRILQAPVSAVNAQPGSGSAASAAPVTAATECETTGAASSRPSPDADRLDAALEAMANGVRQRQIKSS